MGLRFRAGMHLSTLRRSLKTQDCGSLVAGRISGTGLLIEANLAASISKMKCSFGDDSLTGY